MITRKLARRYLPIIQSYQHRHCPFHSNPIQPNSHEQLAHHLKVLSHNPQTVLYYTAPKSLNRLTVIQDPSPDQLHPLNAKSMITRKLARRYLPIVQSCQHLHRPFRSNPIHSNPMYFTCSVTTRQPRSARTQVNARASNQIISKTALTSPTPTPQLAHQLQDLSHNPQTVL